MIGRKKRNKNLGNNLESYAERNYWCSDNKLWKKFETKLARLPTEVDKERWVFNVRPSGFLGFTGTHNNETVAAMKQIAEDLTEGYF